MLSPSDFNSAVPQFTNGNYASNPVNPQYIAEPSSTDYNRGAEPLQTLPAQWWNWFLNKFTSRFNKLNVYVKNIFNELSQLLSLAEMTPDGTEGTPTVEQLKTMFACCYPSYVKETEGLVPNTTTVNGHALTGNVSVTRSDLGLGTSATVNTGSGAGCIPTVGTALGSTANKIVLTTSSGTLQPSSSTVGSAAYCDASCFRASTWTPTCVACAGANGSGVAFGSAATCDASCFRASTWTPSCVTCATKISRTGYTSAYSFDVLLTNGSTTADGTVAYVSNQCRLLFCNTTGVLTAKTFCGSLSGTATNANKVCTTLTTANSDRNLLIGEATYTGTCCAGVYVGNSCKVTFNTSIGVLKATCFCGTASCAISANYLCVNNLKLCIFDGIGGRLNLTGYCNNTYLATTVDLAFTAGSASCLDNFGCASCENYGCATGRHLGPLAIVKWKRGALQCDVWKALEFAVGSAVGCAAGTCARPLTTMLSTCYVSNNCNYIGATGQISSSCSECQQATNNARIFINSGGCESYITFSGLPTTAVNVYRGCSNKIVAGSYETSGQVMFSIVPIVQL